MRKTANIFLGSKNLTPAVKSPVLLPGLVFLLFFYRSYTIFLRFYQGEYISDNMRNNVRRYTARPVLVDLAV